VLVFEVDHPATQAAKRSVVESLGLSSAMVTYVAVDFERQSLEQQLRAAGLGTGMPTLFIWEGVTNYLSDSAVDETLLTIGRLWFEVAREELNLVEDIWLPAPVKASLELARQEREHAQAAQETAAGATRDAVRALVRDGRLSVRDAADVLGLSHQRVQQLLAS
jgi:methyltransferase (TIGR00027 family)